MIATIKFSGPLHEKSYYFALDIIRFCRTLMEQRKEYVLSKQLLRSATSIGANITEAQQAQSPADFISKLSIALKEANETRYWLHLIQDSSYGSSTESYHRIEEIIRILVSSIQTTRNKKA